MAPKNLSYNQNPIRICLAEFTTGWGINNWREELGLQVFLES